MKRTYIGRALTYEMQREKLSQSALEKLSGVPQPTISQIVSSEVRIAPASLKALTHCWPTPETNKRVLISHLRDEIHRAGHDPENTVDMRWPDGRRATTMAERSLAVIQRHLSDPQVSALVHDLANLLKRAEHALTQTNPPNATEQAAESQESYLKQ